MSHVENDLDIYYAVGNANTQRQENEILALMRKRNSAGWKLISTSTAVVDIKNQFSNLYLFWEKKYMTYLILVCRRGLTEIVETRKHLLQ